MKKQTDFASHVPSSIKTKSSEAQVYYKRGVKRFELQDYQGSIADLNMALRLDPKNKWHYLYLGIAKMGIKDYDGAIDHITRAIELNPMFTAAYYSRGLLRIELGQNESGLSDLNKASELGGTVIYEGIDFCNN